MYYFPLSGEQKHIRLGRFAWSWKQERQRGEQLPTFCVCTYMQPVVVPA